MPLETLEDIIEGLADKLGIYGAHDDENDAACRVKPCRMCWTSDLEDHLLAAFQLKQTLSALGPSLDAAPPAPPLDKICPTCGTDIRCIHGKLFTEDCKPCEAPGRDAAPSSTPIEFVRSLIDEAGAAPPTKEPQPSKPETKK